MQDKVLMGGVCDHLNINTFASLREVLLSGGDIEEWALGRTSVLIAVASQSTDPPLRTVVLKLGSLAKSILDPEFLSPKALAKARRLCRESLTEWLFSMAAAIDDDTDVPKPIALQQALIFRLRAGVTSTKALVKRICEVDIGVNRSCITGLSDSTVLRFMFTSACDGESEEFAEVAFWKDRTEVILEPQWVSRLEVAAKLEYMITNGSASD
ncbi:uncharacterized protein AB675_7737 [Cyphellophora attinorum]|uniref:Uncharacterized protein n=1 Tax=Cyphellophora attinorum TaxID=1664694 RepID=A0A0N0NMN8_9EURO|nr:uncharacterized protein AB675_7737 [Phialophora attinorum]KPI40568.1 hypothetical protein AB675_7737 [Phialophora attinorum]